MATSDNDNDPLFVKDGLRHYRRRYSMTEVRWGFACGGVLLGILTWVVWRGAHPDPALFTAGVDLLAPATATAGSVAQKKSAPPQVGPAAAAAAAGRGALPTGLDGDGWREEKYGQFTPENLYVKIDGRADFFLAFAFRGLDAITLSSIGGGADGASVDIEMYDLGKGPNALGAYSGERSGNVKTVVGPNGMFHHDRNALYMTRGRYYVRLIGSDESDPVQKKIEQLKDIFVAKVEGEPLPWAYGLLVGQMGFDPGKISYLKQSAFSFGFANDLYAVKVAGGDSDPTEIFIVACADDAGARALAKKFGQGFLEYGAPGGKVAGLPLVKDRYIGRLAGALARGRFVVGVRGAADSKTVGAVFQPLLDVVDKMPEDLRAKAVPAGENPAGPAGSAASENSVGSEVKDGANEGQ